MFVTTEFASPMLRGYNPLGLLVVWVVRPPITAPVKSLALKGNEMKRSALAVSTILAVFSCSVFAAEDVGPYVGGNLGVTSIKTANEQQKLVNDLVAAGFTSASMGMDQASTGFKVLGGYRFSENFAAEAYYASLGTYKFTVATTGPAASGSGEMKMTATGVDLLGMFPFSSAHTGYVRVGYFQGTGDATITVGGASSSSSSKGSDFKVGFGDEWKITPALRLRGEFEYYNDKDTPISVLSVGLIAHF